jgi:hypothetical protein
MCWGERSALLTQAQLSKLALWKLVDPSVVPVLKKFRILRAVDLSQLPLLSQEGSVIALQTL